MHIDEIKKTLNKEEYNFLRSDEHLGDNIILLGVGGSHAYGCETPESDIDIRGIALNSKREILLSEDFDQVTDLPTDTVVYSLNKMINLLSESNPNTIEILGLKPEHYLHLTDIGEELLANKKMFLSKVCIPKFLGYAEGQMRRLENKSARKLSQEEFEKHILKTVKNAEYEFKRKYYPLGEGNIKLYIDEAVTEGYNVEIFMDVDGFKHYPLRDALGMWNEAKAIVSSFNKNSKRNEYAASHDKLGKHMSTILMLYMKGIDILEKEDVITYREKEHDLIMDIRKGKYLDSNSQPIPEFYEIVNDYAKRFEYAKENTSLPDFPDYKKIKDFKAYAFEKIVKGEI